MGSGTVVNSGPGASTISPTYFRAAAPPSAPLVGNNRPGCLAFTAQNQGAQRRMAAEDPVLDLEDKIQKHPDAGKGEPLQIPEGPRKKSHVGKTHAKPWETIKEG